MSQTGIPKADLGTLDPQATAKQCKTLQLRIPKKFKFLLEMHRFKVMHGGRGGGKCFAFGTQIIMADGSVKAIENIEVGEEVLGPDSLPRRVLHRHQGNSQLFRISQTSGCDYTVSDHHLLSVKKSKSAINDTRVQKNGNARNPKGRYPSWSDIGDIDIQLFAIQSKRFQSHFRGYRAGLLKFPTRKVELDPYLLGVWLGDGTSRELRITSADEEVIDYCRRTAKAWGGDISMSQKHGQKAYDIGFRIKDGKYNPLWSLFKDLNLPNNKHIPEMYLVNSEETRLRVLAGLIDSDGHLHHNGYQIAQTSYVLARQIKHLADTLGFRTSITKKKTICTNNGATGEAFTVYINGDTWRVPCRIARKRVAKSAVSKNKDFLLSQLSITPLNDGDWAGISLSGDQHFLLADGTVVHNSWAVADCLLALGAAQKLRILCAREIQDSIKQSVHKLLSDRIAVLGLGGFYKILDTEIRGANGTEITFTGLGRHTAESIKSFEGIDIVWVEEAQTVAERSWAILIPTIRAKNSEIWVTFNPDMDTDPVWQRFIVNKPTDEAPFDCVVCEVNWNDNPYFPEVLNRERLHCKKVAPDDYENIWEGKCRTSIVGAIYARELGEMYKQQRIRPVPYDPRYRVHRIWDLGWNDAMTIVMVQKPHPSVLNVINYLEDSFQRYDELVADMRQLRYNWGFDWLPHDAINKNPITGSNAYQTLRRLGCRVKPPMAKTDANARIKAARIAAPRIYIDPTDHSKQRQTGFLGGARLIECLRHYRRGVPLTTGEPGQPVHDQYSHGADAFGAMCEIAEMIVDEGFEDMPVLPAYSNPDPAMGLLG